MNLIHAVCVMGLIALPSTYAAARASVGVPDEIPRRPNIVVILTDDQGWGDLSLHGNRNLETPNLDAIARQGAQFRYFYVCPVCSPTRAEFLTGRWHPRVGVHDVTAGGERLNTDEVTIARLFKDAGYRTGLFGKWHNGTQGPYHPNARGFDEFYGFTSGHWGHYFSPMLEANDELTRGSGYLPDDITNHAIRFITSGRKGSAEEDRRPFFVCLTLNTPHSPMQVPDSWWKRVENRDLPNRGADPANEDLAFTRAAIAMVENIDWNVGRLMEVLGEYDLLKETIVVFFCDNGPNSQRWNDGMRGRKGTVDEGGVRSPLFVRWDGVIHAGTEVSRIAGAIDLLPTLTDLAGISCDETKPLDGRSLKPLLMGDAVNWSERYLFAHWNGKVSVRSQKHRLDEMNRLYEMESDPGQTRDLSTMEPEETERLLAARNEFIREVLETAARARPESKGRKDGRPLTLSAIQGLDNTFLPARDAVFSGTLKRSSRHPNCSFLTNWTAEGEIEYLIENPEEGEFAASILHAASAETVGATISLQCLSDPATEVSMIINEPLELPVIGPTEDRTARSESVVRDFGTLELGRIRIPQGRFFLTLKTGHSPVTERESGLEFRGLLLRRISQFD
ncbi:MAG: arylsulfatase [Planctomyces sp.]|nr:arylsulfatase [Planctomyces sp.]